MLLLGTGAQQYLRCFAGGVYRHLINGKLRRDKIMQVTVVLNKKSEIVSAIYQTKPIPEEFDKLRPHMGPVLEDGQTAVELEYQMSS
jgi:hypothetical protein